jgi:hypothetical protein
VSDVEGAVASCRRLPELDRGTIRAEFEERFSARRMAEDYVALYRRLADQELGTRHAAGLRVVV